QLVHAGGAVGVPGERGQAAIATAGGDPQRAGAAGVERVEHQVRAVVAGDDAGAEGPAGGRGVDRVADAGQGVVGFVDRDFDRGLAGADDERAGADRGIGGEGAGAELVGGGQGQHFDLVAAAGGAG